MAATRSSRSATSASRRAAVSLASSSARRLTAAEPLALLPVALEPGLDVDEVGERRAGLQLGDLLRFLGRAGQHLVDALHRLGEPLAGGDDALLLADALSRASESASSAARAARSAWACACSPTASASLAVARTASACSISVRRARRFSSIAGRLIGEPRALGLGLGPPRGEGRDLRLGIDAALVPLLALDGDAGEPAAAKLGLAGEALDRGAGLGERGAVAGDAVAKVAELDGEAVRMRRGGEGGGGGIARRRRFGERRGKPGIGFVEGAPPRGDARHFALGGGERFARGIEGALRLAAAVARGALGLLGDAGLGDRRLRARGASRRRRRARSRPRR